MPVCLHWRRGLQAGSRVCLLGSGVVFWSGFLSVRCLGSGELLMSADRVRHGIRRKRHSRCYILTHRPTCVIRRAKKRHADIHVRYVACMYVCRRWHHAITSLEAARQSKTLLHPPNNYFLPHFSVCVSKRGQLKLLYPYKSPKSFFPHSPHISYQPPSSKSLYLLYCRSLSVFTLLHLCSHSSLLYCCFFSPPSSSAPCLHPPLSLSVCFCNRSVFPIVAVISQIWEGRKAFLF